MSLTEARSLIRLDRGAGWGLSRDSSRLHLACRLRTALGGGLTVEQALRSIIDEPPGLRPLAGGLGFFLETAAQAAADGASLSAALQDARLVEDWELDLLRAGERSGDLIPALEAWSEVLRVRAGSARALPQLLAYPFTLLLTGSLMIGVLGWQVLPTLSTLLTGAGGDFHPASHFAARTASWAAGSGQFAAGLMLILFFGGLLAKGDRGTIGHFFDRILVRLPFSGPARRSASRALGLTAAASSLSAGDSEAVALRIASQVQPSSSLRRAWERLADRVAAGDGPGASSLLGDDFLRRLRLALASDDGVGRLHALASRELDSWWRRAERGVAWAEPLLLLGLGAFLGLQALGWWMAIYSVNWVVSP